MHFPAITWMHVCGQAGRVRRWKQLTTRGDRGVETCVCVSTCVCCTIKQTSICCGACTFFLGPDASCSEASTHAPTGLAACHGPWLPSPTLQLLPVVQCWPLVPETLCWPWGRCMLHCTTAWQCFDSIPTLSVHPAFAPTCIVHPTPAPFALYSCLS